MQPPCLLQRKHDPGNPAYAGRCSRCRLKTLESGGGPFLGAKPRVAAHCVSVCVALCAPVFVPHTSSAPAEASHHVAVVPSPSLAHTPRPIAPGCREGGLHQATAPILCWGQSSAEGGC